MATLVLSDIQILVNYGEEGEYMKVHKDFKCIKRLRSIEINGKSFPTLLVTDEHKIIE